jgi:hypothetical protein
MIKTALYRRVSIAAPWKFLQTAPVVSLNTITSAKVYEEMIRNLSEGFKYAYHSICDAYQSQDTEILEQCLEPNLFKKITNNFSILESQGYKFKRIGSQDPRISLYNLQIILGVNIDRSSNLKKTEYIMIKSLEDLKKMIPLGIVKSQIEKEKVNLDESVLTSCLDYAWVYIQPKAPANILISVDVVYSVEPPLTLMLNGKDAVYEEKINEIHVFKFESEPIRLGTQLEFMSKGKIDKLFHAIKLQKDNLFSQPWTITDIDNILQGNPYTS